jgi:hypothetical protein
MLFWIIPVVFMLYAVLTGGLAVDNEDGFGGQRDIVLANGLQSDVWMDPRETKFDIPFIFHYYSTGKPFGLRLQIWDSSKQYLTIEITEVLVAYQDGEVIRKTNPWVKHLRPYTQYHSSSSGSSQTEMFMLSDHIPELVLRHADVKITLTGWLIKADGQRVAFQISEMFKATTLNRIVTYWQVISSC